MDQKASVDIFAGNLRLSRNLAEIANRLRGACEFFKFGKFIDLLTWKHAKAFTPEGFVGVSVCKGFGRMIARDLKIDYGFSDFFWKHVEPTNIVVHRIDQHHLSWDWPRPVTCFYVMQPVYDFVLPKYRQNLLTARYTFSFQFDIFYQWGDKNLRCYHPSKEFAQHFLKVLEPIVFKFANLRYFEFLNVGILRHTYFSDGKQFVYSHRRGEYYCNTIWAIQKKFNILTMSCKTFLVNQYGSVWEDDFTEVFPRLEEYFAKFKQPIWNCYYEVVPLLGEERIYKNLPKKPIAKKVQWISRQIMR